MMRSVRMIADVMATGMVFRGGMVYEFPDEQADALMLMGWAERVEDPDPIMYRPRVEVAVQTPQEHATALRQRRGITWP